MTRKLYEIAADIIEAQAAMGPSDLPPKNESKC
jgi:hypothetical protein